MELMTAAMATGDQLRSALSEDLAAYVTCRKFRIVRRYVDACQHKGVLLPSLRLLLSPDARSFLRFVEWSLLRVLGAAEGGSVAHPGQLAPVVSLVLSFLPLTSFAPYPISTVGWVDAVRTSLGRSPFAGAAASPMGGVASVTPGKAHLIPVTPSSTKRPREDDAADTTPLGRGPLSEPSSSSMPPLELSMHLMTPDKAIRTPPPQSPGTALTSAPLADQPHFYLRPPLHDITFIFVRMLTPSTLNEEEMNRYFGRYGQVACKRVRCEAVTLSDRGGWVVDAPPLQVPAAPASAARSVSKRGQTGGWWMQDFVVEVDLPANALAALVELRDPSILFIAPSHADRNLFTSGDLDAALATSQDNVAVVHVDETTAPEGDDDAYIPDLVVDHVPYWTTPEQFSFMCAAFGEVASVRYSTDDRSGAFTGAVLLTMSTSEGVRKAAHGLHGKVIEDQPPLVCGVLNTKLQLESVLDPDVILHESAYAEPLLRVLRCGDGTAKGPGSFVNPRLWL